MAKIKSNSKPDASQEKKRKTYYKKVGIRKNTCLECGAIYESKMKRPGYCSPACKYATQKRRNQSGKTKHVGHKNGEYRQCPICGKKYHVTEYFIKKGWKNYCSKECQKKASERVCKCWNCGRDIVTTKSDERHFCSRECQSLWRRKESEKKRTRICQWCGKEFVMSPPSGKANKGEVQEGLFCSRECRFAHMKDKSGWFEVNGMRGKKGDSCNVYFKECKFCHKIFMTRWATEEYCSNECRNIVHLKKIRNRYWKERDPLEPFECEECGKLVVPKYGNRGRKRFCSVKCMNRYNKRIRGNSHKHRARHFGCEYETVDPLKVFARDGWRCQICHKKLRSCNRGTIKDNAPELDHIIPLSQGGEHSYRNTQCTCRKCNSEKSNNIYGQLRIFG